ncbi:unnamed protein product [Fraxinus pennsylvanica]|uniref:GDSL esterase/lipase n=1 Tax=Fraxinus pennsylvanica TaxID=56036 RepID=A0AAD2ABN4_9LAMI|nr:unnamed protein product [Fraxinus pennsylvanica]
MGDSQFDNGNNNLLTTQAKANYPPYGIDYPYGPTGRFTNGRNIADFLGEFLGFDKPTSPFVTANGSEIQEGVNYASGGAGILDNTGQQLGDRFSLNKQLQNHQTTISRLAHLLGSCAPAVLAVYPPTSGSTCVESINDVVELFNNKLKSLVDTFNKDLNGANFIYINISGISQISPRDISAFGVKFANVSCCTKSRSVSQGQCTLGKVPCSNRSDYLFYDNFHSMEIFNKLTAARAYNATLPTDTYPIDIRRLAQQ